MITAERKSVYNLIIEHVSDTINTVVQAIAARPDGKNPNPDIYRADWAERYPSIEDLDVLTATGADDYLPTCVAYPERYPSIAFYIDAAEPNPALDDSECFLGRMSYELYVNRENYKHAQREFFEIQDAIRSILFHDKSLGVIGESGGLLDQIQTLGFSDFLVDRDTLSHFIVGARFSFMIAFREDYNR